MTLFFYIFTIFLGLSVGSFLNAWIWRLHAGSSVVHGRSVCPKCGASILWYDNIPVVSFFLLSRKCRKCQKKISWRYPLTELATACLFVFTLSWFQPWNSGFSFLFWRDLFLIIFLIVVFSYDLLYGEILDRMTTIPAVILLILTVIFGSQSPFNLLFGVLIGAGFFLLQYLVSRGKWVGGGDVRLGLFMGVILGFPKILLALMIAYILGAGVSIVLIALRQKTLAETTVFGPYLVLATFFMMFWGDRILSMYKMWLDSGL